MKKKSASAFGIFTPRVLVGLTLCTCGIFLGMFSVAATPLVKAKRPPLGVLADAASLPSGANGTDRLPPGVPLPTGAQFSAKGKGEGTMSSNDPVSVRRPRWLEPANRANLFGKQLPPAKPSGSMAQQSRSSNKTAPAPASPVWSIVDSPNNTTLAGDSLDGGIVCVSAAECWAVGSYDSGSGRQTLIERWDGTAWTIVPSPNATTTNNNLLTSVACASTADCWAVGRYFADVGRTLIEHWDGSSWSIVPSPNASSNLDTFLYGVTCASASECWAVGYYSDASGNETFIERWDGTSWSIVSSPNQLSSGSSANNNTLYGVACVATASCWAVGFGGDVSQTLIERWDGASWTIDTSPPLPTPSVLSAVTCVSASLCWAVGFTQDSSNVAQALIEQWNGTSWLIVPGDSTNATAHSYLDSVACASASDCWAVGGQDIGAGYQILMERWNGTLWTIVASPNPSAVSNLISGVACVSSTICWAAGSYYAGDNADQTFSERWNGSSWTIVTTANIPPVDTNNLIRGIACASASDCWAVGYYLAGIRFQTLAEHWNGKSWVIVNSPNATEVDNVLYGVSCVSSSDCWAVGHYFNSNKTTTNISAFQTFVEHWNGASWTIVSSPNAGTGVNNGLESVSCLSESNCWAVGYYYPSASGTHGGSGPIVIQTLIERWDGTSWTIVPSANTDPIQNNFLFGVACASASECWSVGNFYNGSNDQTLVERWDGTSWVIVTSQNSSATEDNDLSSIGCVSALRCWAVGYYHAGGKVYQTLIEGLSGGSWMITSSPNASAAQHNLLLAVTCAPGSECWAVGIYINGLPSTLIERWDGASWAIISSPNTSPMEANYLYAATCLSASQCWAGGVSVADHGHTLLEALAVPVQLVGAASRKVHGSAGTFDVDLPLTGNPGIECRSGGENGDYTIVLTFANPLTSVGSTAVRSGVGSVSNSAIGSDAHEYIVTLSGVTNAQTITVSLTDVTDSAGNFSAAASASMNILLGDTTADGVVNSGDIAQTKSQSGTGLTNANFREDVTVDGSINSADISLVKSKSGTGLP